MFVLRPLLFAAIAQADVVGVFDDGREFEAPGVEESSLESYRTRTHDDESGNQYNFVEQAAREAKGAAGGKTLSDLLAGGAEVEVVDGAAASGLHDLIKQMFAAATKPSKPKPAVLPSVPPDTPVSQLLKMIRQSTHDIPPVAPRRASPGRSSDAGEASYLDHMDVTGLELLEAELLQKVPSLPSPHPSPRRHPLLTRCESLRSCDVFGRRKSAAPGAGPTPRRGRPLRASRRPTRLLLRHEPPRCRMRCPKRWGSSRAPR